MAFDTNLIERVRVTLSGTPNVEDRKMFGGYFFLVNGRMCACVRGDELMVRIDPKGYEAALTEPGTHPMIKRGRRIIGSVFVAGSELTDERTFQKWIDRALAHTKSLSEKP